MENNLKMRDPKSMGDMMLGAIGVFTSLIANIIETTASWLPWLLGVCLTCVAMWNQIQQAKLNQEKIGRMNKRRDFNNKNKRNDN